MPQAIRTHYLPPTNYRGARIVATAQAGRKLIAWDHELDPVANHRAAAQRYAKHFDWRGKWAGGQLPDHSYVWCVCDRNGADVITVR